MGLATKSVIISKYLVPSGYQGITIFPFIILRNKNLKRDSILINHERIHLRQQLELLVLPFYLIYGLEFFIRLLQYRTWSLAYKSISFEKEAYANEANLEYLKNRPFWNFITFL